MIEIADKVGINKSTVRYHIKKLKKDGKVKTKKQGKKKFAIWDGL